MISKCSNLVQDMTLGYPRCGMVLGFKGQKSRSQGHKVPKHIEGDRVAGVSLHLYLLRNAVNIKAGYHALLVRIPLQ